MEEIDVNTSLLQTDLFDLFRKQLKKDFEGAGIDADFVDHLPFDFDSLKQLLITILTPLMRKSVSPLPGLLYRVDISEHQLSRYQTSHPTFSFEELVSELIIKRVLQKVILKKTFSK